MVGGWLRLLPEILGQPTPVAALATGSATTAKKLRGGGGSGPNTGTLGPYGCCAYVSDSRHCLRVKIMHMK